MEPCDQFSMLTLSYNMQNMHTLAEKKRAKGFSSALSKSVAKKYVYSISIY